MMTIKSQLCYGGALNLPNNGYIVFRGIGIHYNLHIGRAIGVPIISLAKMKIRKENGYLLPLYSTKYRSN